jgi:hypothetical protein
MLIVSMQERDECLGSGLLTHPESLVGPRLEPGPVASLHFSIGDCCTFFPEHNTAVSLLDRLVHHGIVVVASDESFRMKVARSREGQSSTKK